jgi:hypothetical protein
MTPLALREVRNRVARLCGLELSLVPDFVRDPRWLLLPPAKKLIALQRLKALQAYDALDEPTTKDAQKAAKSIGVRLRRFYDLLTGWRSAERSPFALVPHQSSSGPRKSRLADGRVAQAITTSIKELLATQPMAPPRSVIRHVRAQWNGPGKLPSDVTIRNYHTRAMEEQRPGLGKLTINIGNNPQEDVATADYFGEVVVIDHTSAARLFALEDRIRPVTITLAIDLYTAAPIGVSVYTEYPSPAGVLDALQDAKLRLAKVGSDKIVKPRLVFASTFDPQWAKLRSSLVERGYELFERRDGSLHHGGPTKRIIGPKLGDIVLQPKLASRRKEKIERVDENQNSLLPLQDVRWIVQDAVERMFAERVPQESGHLGNQLDLPDNDTLTIGLERRKKNDVSEPRRKQSGECVFDSHDYAVSINETVDGFEIVGAVIDSDGEGRRVESVYVPDAALEQLIEVLKQRSAK